MGVLLECGKKDLTTTKNVLHFVTSGTARYMFAFNKELYFVPVIMILKCLKDVTDSEIYRELMVGAFNDPYRSGVTINMLRELQEEGLFSRDQVREYIGRSFKEKVRYYVPAWYTNMDICDWLMERCVAIHTDDPKEKYSVICVMIKKLFAYVQNKCVTEGVDSLMMHEIVLGGHLYLQLVKEKLADWLVTMKAIILRKAKSEGPGFSLTPETMNWCAARSGSIEKPFENFLGTGNLPSKTGLGLMQNKGLTIMAENINRMRYMSHFRAIHRGSFFQEMRTTEVRALLPDAWGFVCPVHTPDGSPCGLLNHLSMPVEIVTHIIDVSKIPGILIQLGMIPYEDLGKHDELLEYYDVLLDGKVLGWVASTKIRAVSEKLRAIKINPNDPRVPTMTEIAYIPNSEIPGNKLPPKHIQNLNTNETTFMY